MATLVKDEPKPIGAICPGCDRPIAVVIRGQWRVWEPDYMDNPMQFTAGSCPDCHQVLLYGQDADLDLDPNGAEWDDPNQIYPASFRPMSFAVPSALRAAHEEAHKCLRAKAYNATVIMARRVLEGICHDLGYTGGRNLNDRLKEMQSAGVIDSRLYDWADVIRDIGNEGAHEVGSSIARQDAEEVLTFVEALLDYLYAFRSRYDEFKARRDTQKAAGAAKRATAKKATAKKATA